MSLLSEVQSRSRSTTTSLEESEEKIRSGEMYWLQIPKSIETQLLQNVVPEGDVIVVSRKCQPQPVKYGREVFKKRRVIVPHRFTPRQVSKLGKRKVPLHLGGEEAEKSRGRAGGQLEERCGLYMAWLQRKQHLVEQALQNLTTTDMVHMTHHCPPGQMDMALYWNSVATRTFSVSSDTE